MKFLFCSSRGRARKAGFYALFSKIFSFWLRIGAIFIRISDLWLRNGAILEPVFYLLWFSGAILEPNPIHGIKIDAGFGSRFFAVASKLMPFWLPPHLFGLGGGVLVGVFEKSPDILLLCWNLYIAPSLTPCLKAILWTPLKKISSPNPRLEAVLSTYHRKFRLNLLQQLLEPKNDIFFEKVSISLLLHWK